MLGGFLQFGGLFTGITTIAAGIMVLVWQKILAYIIGIYLIIAGLITVIAVLR